MPALSPMRLSAPVLEGITLLNRGKVRDTYDLEYGNILVVCSDGISIFDFVLNCLVPQKGSILMAMTHFWLMYLESFGIHTHFVTAGVDIDTYLPDHLRNDTDLQSRSMVVRKLDMHKVEFIFRNVLTGSVLKEYQSTGMVYGQRLLGGLQDGDRLPFVLDTPTTKAEVGHDEPLDAAEIRAKYPEATMLLFKVMSIVADYSFDRGILYADSKFEVGVDSDGVLTVGDEVATPDSSRFWDLAEWQKSRTAPVRKAPSPFDKQFVRIQGIKWGLNDKKQYDPEKPEDVARVHQLKVPEDLVRVTTQTYRYIFWRLTGKTLEQYLDQDINVGVSERRKSIDLIFGSESDFSEVAGILKALSDDADFRLHVISCHRNPGFLREYVYNYARSADVIIASGGMAFALPGVLDAQLYANGLHVPVIGVALGSDLEAAQLSISKLPGTPVLMDETNGRVYSGRDGFREALERAVHGELPPQKVRTDKPAQFNISLKALL